MRKKKLLIVIFICISFLLGIKVIQNKNVYAGDTATYDVILFFGQSNMQGCMSDENERFDNENKEQLENYAQKSGIDIDILQNTTKMNYTRIEQQPSTIYEYKYITNNLEEVSADTQILGELLTYNKNTKKLEAFSEGKFGTLLVSKGINIIPEFCRTYYERTGHKVVIVMGAVSGQRIERFLPVSDIDYTGSNSPIYMYEGIVEKYQSAISYLQENGYTIGNKLWVSCQGESNVAAGTSKSEYQRIFLKVHNNLKNDLGITKGAIIQTSTEIGAVGRYSNVEIIHQAQEAIIEENNDIILGSSYPYERYVPDQETYESEDYINKIYVDVNGNKLNYNEAFNNASYSVCYPNNTIHFSSAGLSQIGRETAISFSNAEELNIISIPTKNKYIQNYDNINLEGGKVRVKFNNGTVEEIDMNDPRVEISGFDNTEIGTNTVQVKVRGKTTSFTVNIIPKSIVDIKIKQKPIKNEYVQNSQELDLTGGIIEIFYNDETTEEIDMNSSNVVAEGFDNTTLGVKEIIIKYEGKQDIFTIEIIEKQLIELKIKEIPNKKEYIQNYDNLDLRGGILTLRYNDETIEEIQMNNPKVRVTGFNNSILGSNEITVRYEGKTTTFLVQIVKKQLIGILIKQLPIKTEYIQNYDKLDLTGGIITLKYNDESSEDIEMDNSDVEVTGFSNSEIGRKTITVKYGGKSVIFTVEIVGKSIIDIQVKNKPTQTEYIQQYEELNLEGGVILIKYSDETTSEIEMTNAQVEVEGFDNKEIGIKTIIVKYQNKSATFTVEVVEKMVQDIEIKNMPIQLEYVLNYEQLDLRGGTILVKYNDQTVQEIEMINSQVTAFGFDNSKLGEQMIVLKYAEKTTNFSIKIIDKSIISISVKQKPLKIKYIQNYEQLCLDGGVLLIKYNDETEKEVELSNSQIILSGFDNSKLGQQLIVVSYGNKTTTFQIEIIEKSVIKIEIIQNPNKLKYIRNQEKLDLSGGEILVQYNDNTQKVIKMEDEIISVTGYDNSVIGKQIIQITYAGMNINLEIEIIEEKKDIEENEELDNSVSKNELPDAGKNIKIFIIIGFVMCLAAFFKKKYDKIQLK